MTTHDPVIEAAAEAFRQSASAAAIGRAGDVAGRAWHQSQVRGAAAALGRAFVERPVAVRLRLVGLSLLAFAATVLAAGLVLPVSIAPGFPALFWLPAAVGGVLLLGAAEGGAAAWAAKRRAWDTRRVQKKKA
jgi:hypothetical protein